MSWISSAHGSRRERSTALSQTQRISGLTSQLPSGRTPPQGPLRSVFGHSIGQVMPVEWRTHWPHMWQPKTGFLTACLDEGHRLHQAGTALRLRSIRSFASRTAAEASDA